MRKLSLTLLAIILTTLPFYAQDTLSVMVIGDVMMHESQLSKDHKQFLRFIAPQLRKADISIANMEFSLGGEPYTGYPEFSTPDSYAEYVAGDCGVDVFLTANNHILDRRAKGLERTLEVYRRMADSVKFTGTAGSQEEMESNYPLILDKKGIRLAIVNFTYGTNSPSVKDWPNVNYMEADSIAKAVSRAKERESDFILVLPHWGEEYSLKHNAEQEKWAEWIVAQGVNAIIGSHPHVVQDTTHINGVPVIYSMGNAVSNMSAINTRLELAVVLKFTIDHITGKKSMLEPEIQYMWCSLPDRLTDNYSTIFVKEWAERRDEWANPSDYDNMMDTYERVKAATGVVD